MLPQYMFGQKVVAGIMALLFLLNMNIGGSTPHYKAKIYNLQEGHNYVIFYGTLSVNGKEKPMAIRLTAEEQTINKNEKKKNININEDKTLGDIEIIVEKGRVVYKKGKVTDEDREFLKQITPEIKENLSRIQDQKLREKVQRNFNGFLNYVNRPKKSLIQKVPIIGKLFY